MHFRRFLPLLIGALALSSATAQDIKCATVDVSQLLTQYHLTQSEISVFQTELDHYIAEQNLREETLNHYESRIKVLIAVLKDKTLPQGLRSTHRLAYEELLSQYNTLNKESQKSAHVQEINWHIDIAKDKLLDDIHSVIRKFAKKKNYHWIIETSGNSNSQVSPLVYARDATDITDDIIEILNKDAP